jgi:flavin-binding protein dodecin
MPGSVAWEAVYATIVREGTIIFPGAVRDCLPKQGLRETDSEAGNVARKEHAMGESVYKVVELVGTSPESWEKAATAAVETASKTLRDLRVAEIVELDMQIEDGKVRAYRARVKLSFKYLIED